MNGSGDNIIGAFVYLSGANCEYVDIIVTKQMVDDGERDILVNDKAKYMIGLSRNNNFVCKKDDVYFARLFDDNELSGPYSKETMIEYLNDFYDDLH